MRCLKRPDSCNINVSSRSVFRSVSPAIVRPTPYVDYDRSYLRATWRCKDSRPGQTVSVAETSADMVPRRHLLTQSALDRGGLVDPCHVFRRCCHLPLLFTVVASVPVGQLMPTATQIPTWLFDPRHWFPHSPLRLDAFVATSLTTNYQRTISKRLEVGILWKFLVKNSTRVIDFLLNLHSKRDQNYQAYQIRYTAHGTGDQLPSATY